MTKVKNAPKTGDLEPQDYTGFSSWIAYWESKKKYWKSYLIDVTSHNRYLCSKCGESFTWDDFDGAHVLKVNSEDKKKYIYPLCQGCNRSKDETPFDAIESLFVPMPDKKN